MIRLVPALFCLFAQVLASYWGDHMAVYIYGAALFLCLALRIEGDRRC